MHNYNIRKHTLTPEKFEYEFGLNKKSKIK